MSSAKFFLPKSRYFSKKWGDKELDLLSRLVYNPVSGLIYRQRYKMALPFIPMAENCLEIGCGYGLFLPVLSKKIKELYAMDVHPYLAKVKQMLEGGELIEARLSQGNIFHLPYKDSSFNVIICLSVLEHMGNAEAPILELKRVLKKNGVLIAGFPIKNYITKMLFKLIQRNDDVIHPQSHTSLLTELRRHFKIQDKIIFPRYLPLELGFYFVGKFINKNE